MPDEMTPEKSAIWSEIDSILQSDSYRNAFSPDHPATQEKVQALYSKLYPEEGGEPEQPRETPSATLPTPDALDSPLTPEEAQHISPLQQEWGSNWQANVEAAQGVVESLSKDLGTDVADFLEDSRLGSHPIVIKAMYAWSRSEPGPDISAAEAKAILDMARKSELFQKGDSRARDTLLDVVQALYSVVHPEG
jgi:hypothetical protein